MAAVPLNAMILRFLFYAFLFYMLYKLVFNFIIPVYKTTRRVKNGFKEMNEKMRQQAEGFQQQNTQQVKPKVEQHKAGDYIEFEEVKD
jgi:hypothetical protein